MINKDKVLVSSEVRTPLSEREKRPNRTRLIAAIAITAALTAGGVGFTMNKMASYPSTTVSNEAIPATESDPTGAVDKTIDSVMLFDGAEAHTLPRFVDTNAGDPNDVIETIHNADGVVIDAPERNVLVKDDSANHLKWYGVQRNGKTEWVPSTQAVPIREEK